MTTPSDWITVGALADGFAPDAFILPNLADLNGKTLIARPEWAFLPFLKKK